MTRQILIADGHASRRRRLAEAFRAADGEAEVVGDGAKALERALSTPPALVIAQTDLPLVEATKLAEILRANPRTRGARFVFIGELKHFVDSGGLSDVFLPRDASISDIVSTAEAELSILGRLTALNRVVENEERPRGYFPDVPLLEVLHCLHLWKCSGRLDLQREGQHSGHGRGAVWLREGEVVDAECGETHGRKALYRVMDWEQGRFALDPTGLHVNRAPLAPLRPLLVEGTRQLSERARLGDQLPSLDDSVGLRVRGSELPNILHPLTQEVLTILERHWRVRDVVERCSYPDYQVLRTLSTLANRHIIDLGSARSSTSDETCLFDEQQIRRLNEWALAGGSDHAAGVDLKLLVAASGPSAFADFVALIRGIPGASLAEDFDSGAADERSFATLGRLNSNGGVGIELINVPTSEEMAPLWPMAGAGGLGTLFLLSGPVGEAASNVQPMLNAMRRLTRNRIFNLFLFHKDEPISPAELGENLSLIDEASLFMLPLEGGKPPLALLRSVFGRVIP